jgi:VIT1/CCC1 family predicted Fe2+/Mn2+ transporter
MPEQEADEVRQILRLTFGVDAETGNLIVGEPRKRPQAWVDFMMRFELGLEKPKPRRAFTSAATIAAGYVAGGFIPLAPYFAVSPVHRAVWYSAAVTCAALALVGHFRARVTGTPALRSALQTLGIGGLAAGAAYALARFIA